MSGTFNHREKSHTRRGAVYMVLVVVSAAWTTTANADFIAANDLDSRNQSFWLIDNPLMSSEHLFGSDFHDRGCRAGESGHSLNYPSAPVDQGSPEVPFVGLSIPYSQSGAGASSDSSNGNSSSSSSNAIINWFSELPPSTLVGILYSVEDLDIPPAPPFELLRPPRVLTISA
jgi:hypothetical protein